jgi:hypothetical protein
VAEHIAPMIATGPSGPGGGPAVPPWLDDLSIQIDANPAVVDLGQPTVVSWSVDVPHGAPPLQFRLNGEVVARNGNRSFTPSRRSRFTLSVTGAFRGVTFEKSNFVEVGVRYPSRVVIGPRTPNPAGVLVGALTESTNDEQTVEFCNVDIDLTGFTSIPIGDRRSLIASPGCERSPRRLGPRIFVTDARGNQPLFLINGDHVRVSGFRLEGPTNGIGKGDRKEKGIVISPAASPDPLRSVEISNMEVFHWSGLGIQVVDNVEMAERGRLFNTNPGAVRISGSYFHHNRHGAGEGYGVEVAAGGYATIERNVFDENRHAIAGGSRNQDALDYSGYTARENLILEGGGLHCLDNAGTGGLIGGIVGGIIGGIIGGLVGGPPGAALGAAAGAMIGGVLGSFAGSMCFQTHQVDMHGDHNRWYSSHNWECGTAGETMLIGRNTILYTGGHTSVPFTTNGLAIKIRGNPADKAVVDGNVFKHKTRGDAIGQNGSCGFWGDNISKPIDVRPNNQFNVNPITELGSGDYFGDGQQDQFMATGVTWWAKSPVTHQWRYLNTMRERLPQLDLRRADSDAIFDVVLRPPPGEPAKLYSKSGTGPWEPLPKMGGVQPPITEPPVVLQ